MNKAHVELLYNSKEQHQNGSFGPDASVIVKVSQDVVTVSRAHATPRMNTSEGSSPNLLMENLRTIRQRLTDTEKALNKISQNFGHNKDIDDVISIRSLDFRHLATRQNNLGANIDNPDDSRESFESGLACLPDFSYAGFERVQPPSSTPNRLATKSRLTGVLDMVGPPTRKAESSRDHKDSEMDDIQDYRDQTHSLKKSNKKVLLQNQKLMKEVEKMWHELNSSRENVHELSHELEELQESVSDLEDKALGLQAEHESQDRALREAEDRYEACHQKMVQTNHKYTNLQLEVQEIQTELLEERRKRQSLETQRDEAIQNSIQAHNLLGDYQKESIDRLKKCEKNADDLCSSLTQANREREELFERLTYFQDKVKSQQEEIRHLQSVQEVKDRTKIDQEEQNNELQSHYSQLTAKIAADSIELEKLQLENDQLNKQVAETYQQLSHCQQELKESRNVFIQLQQLAQQQRDTSSIYDNDNSSLIDSDVLSLRDLQNTAVLAETTSLSAKNILSDLRLKMALKDSEILHLQTVVTELEAHDQTSVIDNLHKDLSAIIETNHKSAEQIQELNSQLKKLEFEKEQQCAQIEDLHRELADRNMNSSSFEMTINQQKTQLVDLHDQITDRCLEIATLEKKLQEKSSQAISLEGQLQEKCSQLNQQKAHIRSSEQDIIAHESHIKILQQELRDRHNELNVVKDEADGLQALHQKHCKDYQIQIDILEERVKNKMKQTEEREKQTQCLQQEISDKTNQLYSLEQTLNRTQKKLDKKKKMNEDLLQQLESQVTDGSAQIKQLETTLNLCKKEIDTYRVTLEDTKHLFDKELEQRDDRIQHLEHQHHVTSHELKVKTQKCEQLDRNAEDSQHRLQQSSRCIGELQEVQTQLHKQISSLEHQLLMGNSQWKRDQQSLEIKLKQCYEELESRTKQLKELTSSLKNTDDERGQLSKQITVLNTHLICAHEEQQNNAKHISKLEVEVCDIRGQLERKTELVTDYEDQLNQKNADMEQQLILVRDLDVEIKHLQDMHQEALKQVSYLEKELERTGYEAEAREQNFNDMKVSLVATEEELNKKNVEAANTEKLLEEKERELDERIAQILEFDGKLQQTEAHARELTLHLQQSDQCCKKLQLELHVKTSKLQELEILTEIQKIQLNEHKYETVHITQELKLTREQLQQQHTDFMSTQKELAQVLRELDRLQRELQDTRTIIQSQEDDATRLTEELGAIKACEVDGDRQKISVVQKLSVDQDDIQTNYQFQFLEHDIAEYRDSNDMLQAQLKDKTRQMSEVVQHYNDQLQIAYLEIEKINKDIHFCKHQMENTNEQVVLKDFEIALLQGKISGLEKTILAMQSPGGLNGSDFNHSEEHNQYSQGSKTQTRNSVQDRDRVMMTSDSAQASVPNTRIISHSIEFGDDFEIKYVTRGFNNNCVTQSDDDQEHRCIELSGPAVRVLDCTGCDMDRSTETTMLGICKSNVVLTDTVYRKNNADEPPDYNAEYTLQKQSIIKSFEGQETSTE